MSGEKRSRAHRKRKDGVLEETEDQLLFILHYLKSNGLQKHHAAAYGISQSQCHPWIHLLLKLLGEALEVEGHLPCRDPGKLKKALAGVKEVFIDGTERDIERPQDSAEQKSHYSEKKAHKVKNNLICDRQKRVLYLSSTYGGSKHDKKIVDEEGWKYAQRHQSE